MPREVNGNNSMLLRRRFLASPGPVAKAQRRSSEVSHAGLLILNADDWGRNHETTERTLECAMRGTISSVSAMVFMEDSERAAIIARERGIDTGLHLNFTTPFSSKSCPALLVDHQHRIARRLLQHRLAQVLFYPTLMTSFEYVVSAQIEEFRRLYGAEPRRLDGHHHMHLCTNVLWGRVLPTGSIVRRNFTFGKAEKSWPNRLYRHFVDRAIVRRHRTADLFLSLMPIQAERIQRIVALADRYVVEVETHPANSEEYRFLTGGEIHRLMGSVAIAPRFALEDLEIGGLCSNA